MIQVFKIMKGIDDVHIEDFFQVSDSSTRGYDLKIYKPRCNKYIRQHSFSLRVIEEWNSLPEDVVSSNTVFQFKSKLDKLWIDKRFDDTDIYWVNSQTGLCTICNT